MTTPPDFRRLVLTVWTDGGLRQTDGNDGARYEWHWKITTGWTINHWVVVSTIPNKISQISFLYPLLWKIKNVWNHQPEPAHLLSLAWFIGYEPSSEHWQTMVWPRNQSWTSRNLNQHWSHHQWSLPHIIPWVIAWLVAVTKHYTPVVTIILNVEF